MRLASNERGGPPDKPPERPKLPSTQGPAPGRSNLRGLFDPAFIIESLIDLIENYKADNSPPDLFGYRRGLEEGVIAAGRLDGKPIIGVNSTYGTHLNADRLAAARLRNSMIGRYDAVRSKGNIGRIPNDAFYHAETTFLLRAARENGGTLTGKTLHVLVNDTMCLSCKLLLPSIGQELGNPTVTFVDRDGNTRTMRDGKWMDIKEKK